MDALPSRFINEIPDSSVEKNEMDLTKIMMILILIRIVQLNLMKNSEVLVGKDLRKKCLNGKNKKIKTNFKD